MADTDVGKLGTFHSEHGDVPCLVVARPTLSVEEAAAMLSVSRGAVYDAVKTGQLPHVRIGRRIVIPRSRLLELINGRPTEAA